MRGFFLGAWLAAAAIIGYDWAANGTPGVAMCVWFGATFAGWCVMVLAGDGARGA
jgi:hypothetical protein